MKKYSIISVILVLLIGAGMSSCYPDKGLAVEDLDVVQTQYDTTFDFSSRMYYLLPDTVPLISADSTYVKSAEENLLDQAILDEISTRMDQAGYTRLTAADTSDNSKMEQALVVLPSRSVVSYTDYYYDYYSYGYDYWGSYYGMNYYYPGYYWNNYYPWGFPVSYSYSVGTVIIQMIDPAEPHHVDTNNGEVSYPVRWMATMNGLAETSYSNTEQRIRDGIGQAFDQSPYL